MQFNKIIDDNEIDYIVTPSTASCAPKLGEREIDDTCLIWTYFGLPVVSIPLFYNEKIGLPYGLQIVAPRYHDFRLLEFHTNNLINNNSLKCENIENLKKNVGIKIIERNDIKYSSLNDYIKENMSSINDFIIFEKDSINIYVLLCDIKYNNEYFDNININENIDLIVKKIENDLIFNKINEYNFYLK